MIKQRILNKQTKTQHFDFILT